MHTEVIIIAGVASSGKSHIQEKLFSGNLPALASQLGIYARPARLATEMRSETLYDGMHPRLCIHCDLYNRAAFTRASKVIETFDGVTVLTVVADSQTLVLRNRGRITGQAIGLLRNLPEFSQHVKKIRSLVRRQTKNKNGALVVDIYRHWFKLLEAKNVANSYWIDSTKLAVGSLAQPIGSQGADAIATIDVDGEHRCRPITPITDPSLNWLTREPNTR